MDSRPNFVLDCTVTNPYDRPTYKDYNSLKDNHLRGYFNEKRKSHLVNNNIVIFLLRYQMMESLSKIRYSIEQNKLYKQNKILI